MLFINYFIIYLYKLKLKTMKKLLFIIVLTLVSCSKEKQPIVEPIVEVCECQKITYNATTDLIIEDIGCQEPIREIPIGENLWFRVVCK